MTKWNVSIEFRWLLPHGSAKATREADPARTRRRTRVRKRGEHVTCHVADTVHVADAGWCEGEGRRRTQDHEWMDLAHIGVVASTNVRG